MTSAAEAYTFCHQIHSFTQDPATLNLRYIDANSVPTTSIRQAVLSASVEQDYGLRLNTLPIKPTPQ